MGKVNEAREELFEFLDGQFVEGAGLARWFQRLGQAVEFWNEVKGQDWDVLETIIAYLDAIAEGERNV